MATVTRFVCVLVLGLAACQSDAVYDLADGEEDIATRRQELLRDTARRLALALDDNTTRRSLFNALDKSPKVALRSLTMAEPLFEQRIADELGAVPEVWLYTPNEEYDEASTLVAFEPSGDDRDWKAVEAFGAGGAPFTLDPWWDPDVPVLVVETHGQMAMEEAVANANRVLEENGLFTPQPTHLADDKWTTKLDAIWLADDAEPWISGAAEIYFVVSGVLDNNKPQLNLIAMPYIDHDGQFYYPGQIVIDWDDYTYSAVNIQFFEHDDNTNYKQILDGLISAIGQGAELAGMSEVAAVTKIADMILTAMPSHWFSNDDDYVDSFYTIQKYWWYKNHPGAAQNAYVTLNPFLLTANDE